jgi:hypothetical protein
MASSIERLRQRWSRVVEDVTPSFLPIRSSPGSPDCDTFGQLQIHLDASVIHEYCESSQLSPFDLVRTAWVGLLEFYTGSEGVLFGTIELGPSAEDGQCTKVSLCRAKIQPEKGMQIEIQEEGILETDRLIPLSDALDALSSLSPKPFNSTVWLCHPLQEPEGNLHQRDLLTISSNSMVSIPSAFCRSGKIANQRVFSLTTFYKLIHQRPATLQYI